MICADFHWHTKKLLNPKNVIDILKSTSILYFYLFYNLSLPPSLPLAFFLLISLLPSFSYLRITDGSIRTKRTHAIDLHKVGLGQFNKLRVVVLLGRVGVQAGGMVKHVFTF